LKPLFGDNGSGMHTHFSFWKGGNPLFAGGGYAGLSEMAIHAIGGVLKHAPSILAFSNPTTNSYKRLVPGYEAPVNLAYSQRNRSACCRIPMYSPSPKAKRVEFRCPDPGGNPSGDLFRRSGFSFSWGTIVVQITATPIGLQPRNLLGSLVRRLFGRRYYA
jgi:Glutamine synthetase, catalytic domain